MKQVCPLLLIVLAFSLLWAEEEVDPFSPPPVPEEEKTEIWIFTIRPDGPLIDGLPKDYNPMDDYDEILTPLELAMIKFFHNEGADFMEVPEATLCISSSSVEALTWKVMGIANKPTRRGFIIVKQTKENLIKIHEILKSFGDPVNAEPAGAINSEAAASPR